MESPSSKHQQSIAEKLNDLFPLRDAVFLRNFTVHSVIGLDCWHRAKPQTTLITVKLPLPPASKSIEKDSLDETLDYRLIRNEIVALSQENHSSLFHFADFLWLRLRECFSTADQQGVLDFNPDVTVVLPKATLNADSVAYSVKIVGGHTLLVLSINNLNLSCVIGITPRERETKQPVKISLKLFPPLGKGKIKDFEALVGPAVTAFEATKFLTVEAFALAMAEYFLCLGFMRVTASASKPTVFDGCDGPGYEVTRHREINLKLERMHWEEWSKEGLEKPEQLEIFT